MTQSANTDVTLERAALHAQPVLLNLFELYAHDFSEHVAMDLHESGRFEVTLAEAWWTDVDHHPFFIRRAGKLIGFALVRKGSHVQGSPARDVRDVMDIAEFFVVRGARRHQVGLRAAHALFRMFAGRWEIRVRESNASALRFWSRVADAWNGTNTTSTFEARGVRWHLLSLEPERLPHIG